MAHPIEAVHGSIFWRHIGKDIDRNFIPPSIDTHCQPSIKEACQDNLGEGGVWAASAAYLPTAGREPCELGFHE